MTEQEAFDKAIVERCRKIVTVPQDFHAGWKAALEWARSQQEPEAWMFQHEERGDIEYVCGQQVEWGFERNNPRWQKICPVYTHPAPAPDVSELVEALREIVLLQDSEESAVERIEKALAKWEGKL